MSERQITGVMAVLPSANRSNACLQLTTIGFRISYVAIADGQGRPPRPNARKADEARAGLNTNRPAPKSTIRGSRLEHIIRDERMRDPIEFHRRKANGSRQQRLAIDSS